MADNLRLIEERYKTNPIRLSTLQKIIEAERQDKIGGRNATEGIRWLKRGLAFISVSFQLSLKNPSRELKDCFIEAYETTLKPYHSFVVAPLFKFAIGFVPSRKEFYGKLGKDTTVLVLDMTRYFSALVPVVDILLKYYKDHNLENV